MIRKWNISYTTTRASIHFPPPQLLHIPAHHTILLTILLRHQIPQTRTRARCSPIPIDRRCTTVLARLRCTRMTLPRLNIQPDLPDLRTRMAEMLLWGRRLRLRNRRRWRLACHSVRMTRLGAVIDLSTHRWKMLRWERRLRGTGRGTEGLVVRTGWMGW